MINYRFTNLDARVAQLNQQGIETSGAQDSEYGRFAWISDSEENRIELWQPPQDMKK